jgi:hypothetical protein
MSASSRSDLGKSTPKSLRAQGTRTRTGRVMAATVVAGLTVAGIAVTGTPSASAAEALRAQSVGRLVDGTLGGNPIQQVADVADARATAPGTQSVQNPLDATLLGQLNVPLSGAIDLPTDPAIIAGAANQVAVAHLDGFSYGAAGAVSNSGGANVGGDSDSFPAFGTINLSGAALPSLPSLPLPGVGDLASLGSITATVGAVSALAQTKTGGAVAPPPSYNIAGLTLAIGSPALGGVLKTVGDALVAPALPSLPGLPASCSFSTQVLSPISLAGGAVTVSPTDGKITVNLAKLLAQLGLNINTLPANTDLLAYLLNYLADPAGLAAGLQSTIAGIITPLQTKFTTCLTDFAAVFPAPLAGVVKTVSDLLTGGQTTLTGLVNSLLTPLQNAAGTNPLKPLSDGLKALIDIGINVESGPGIQAVQSDPDFLYTTALAKTPNQATPVVANQTLVRALEINLLGSGAVVALANAAAGPSTAAPAPPTTSSVTTSPGPTNTNIPTGVPAGAVTPAGSPIAPLVLLIVGLVLASGGAVAWKLRGRTAH